MNNKIKYSPGLIAKIFQLLEQKGVTDEKLEEIGIKGGIFSDMAEAIAVGRPINRPAVRSALGVGPLIRVVKKFRETVLYKPVAKKTIPERTDSLDEDLFYQTKNGLCVLGGFRKRFGSSFRKTDSAPEQSNVALELKGNSYEKIIELGFPKRHLTSFGDIAALIKMQWGGKSGILRTDSLGNIFYVEGKFGQVFVVKVYWPTNDCYWGVEGWEFDRGGFWDAGRQFLCPGTAKL